MALNITCSNRKCGKYTEPLLDVERDVVLCSDCEEPIREVTIFFKNQLKSLRQIWRPKKAEQAFAIPCDKCKKTLKPAIVANKAICANCSNPLKVSDAFVHMIKTSSPQGGSKVAPPAINVPTAGPQIGDKAAQDSKAKLAVVQVAPRKIADIQKARTDLQPKASIVAKPVLVAEEKPKKAAIKKPAKPKKTVKKPAKSTKKPAKKTVKKSK